MILLQLFLLFYILVSSIALVIYLYRMFLQYLTPVKGYIIGGMLVFSLLVFDFVLFDFASSKMNDLNHKKNTIEISLN